MSEAVLEVEGVVAGYGAGTVLHGVSLAVASGEALAVLGPNGAGKTTLLRLISGFLAPRRGEVRLDGERISGRPAHLTVRRGVVHVPEGREVFPELSVAENLALGGFARGRVDQERLDAVIELFPRLGERLGQSAETLSGGEQQMLAIARGLMSEPRVLMLDEPTLGLAPVVVEDLVERLVQLRARLAAALLIVEQNAYLAMRTCDRYCVMAHGRIVDAADRMPADSAELAASYLRTTVP